MAKYVFSESANLLCRVTYKYKYEVINGAWDGTYKDGILTVDNYPEYKIEINDWVDIDPEAMSREWQEQWYYRQPSHWRYR